MTTPNESAQKFAKRIREAMDFNGEINLNKLQGKYIEYVDIQCRLMTRKVIKIGPTTVKVIDAAKKKHDVKHEHIIWAFSRKGNSRALKVIM